MDYSGIFCGNNAKKARPAQRTVRMRELTNAIITYLNRLGNYNLPVAALQLFLIGIIVWLVMRFLRGTRGARLVKGAALLLAIVFIGISVLPKTDEWKRIEFLYANFLWFAVVAFIVAFQPDQHISVLFFPITLQRSDCFG